MNSTPVLAAVVDWFFELDHRRRWVVRFRPDVWRRIRQEAGIPYILPAGHVVKILGIEVGERRP